MSDWWTTSDGEEIKDVSGIFESGAIEVIPKGTTVHARVVNAAWGTAFKGESIIQVQWEILKPAAYEGRRIFQKVWCDDYDSSVEDEEKRKKKRDRSLDMLANIDKNAGGKLLRTGRRPTDDDLALALISKEMGLTLDVWDKDEGGRKVPGGNWVRKVWPKGAEDVPEPAKPTAKSSAAFDDIDDEIPF